MDVQPVLFSATAVGPAVLMAGAALLTRVARVATEAMWRGFLGLSFAALLLAGISAGVGVGGGALPAGLAVSPLGAGVALLVQLLGTVIGGFSARYLQGEAGQRRYVAGLASVLCAVHLLLMADHWVVLIAAWAAVGLALQQLLCFYPDRPFALLAAHKKRLADRVADGLLVGAAALAWAEVGSGSLSALWAHLVREGGALSLQLSAVGVVLAVVLRTASLPVHGWLIQVMEAPTPVSALLHAGVVNLGGVVLIRFAPLLEHAPVARGLLVAFGLSTAVLAGMVMLTRISIKVRLAWSTVAQMGFMLLECGLGLYTLAALHLIGHSLYKAHAFLSASSVVRHTRLQALHSASAPAGFSLALAPVLATAVVLLSQSVSGQAAWPWWWSVVLGLAWAPLLWLPVPRPSLTTWAVQVLFGVMAVAGLTTVALLAHGLPLGIQDAPHPGLGAIVLLGMVALYLGLVLLYQRPQALTTWRRWSYAGFYVDEAYTRLALRLWPARWTPESREPHRPPRGATLATDAAH